MEAHRRWTLDELSNLTDEQEAEYIKKLHDEQVVKARAMIAPFQDQAIKFLSHHNMLSGGKLETLSSTTAGRILNMGLYRFKTQCLQYEAPEEKAQRASDAEAGRRAKVIERNIDRLWQITPAEFEKLTEQGAPRPTQFKFLSSFFSAEDSPWHDDDFRRNKHGLYISGEPGLGKTAAVYPLVNDALESGEIEDFEIVKSTTFLRIAKAKHLGSQERVEFTTLFTRMLKTQLLALDDLGTELISEGSRETIFELLDTRMENWRLTIITSNCTPDEVAAKFRGSAAKMRRRLTQYFLRVNFDATR